MLFEESSRTSTAALTHCLRLEKGEWKSQKETSTDVRDLYGTGTAASGPTGSADGTLGMCGDVARSLGDMGSWARLRLGQARVKIQSVDPFRP
jgi:hypothetical protein